MSEVELKPCPFCGGEAEITRFDVEWPGMYAKYEYSGCCNNSRCLADMGLAYKQDCEEDALAAWNTRTPDPRIAELQAALDKSPWISVSERLPELGFHILVQWKKPMNDLHNRIEEVVWDGDWPNVENIDYWMPIPPLPLPNP